MLTATIELLDLNNDAASKLLGSTGSEGQRKQMKNLAKRAEKAARIAAGAAKEARFFQTEPLSPEFEFVVQLRNRCAAGASQALEVMRQKAPIHQHLEARHKSDRVIAVHQLRLMGSSGLLLCIVMQLSRQNHWQSKASAKFSTEILARVAARRTTPEVLLCSERFSLNSLLA